MPAVYIHIPFCVRKCHYCDFFSKELFPNVSKESNVQARHIPFSVEKFTDYLRREIEIFAELKDAKYPIESIFFGGGTPSLLLPEQLNKILETLNSKFDILSDAEITLESNPGTLTFDKLKAFRQAGINRLSIGAQSFVPEELKFLQRIHSADETVQSFENARKAGFDNISMDLIFAIPGQTQKSVNYSMSHALELQPEHISYYSLIYEQGTPLNNDFELGKIQKVSEEQEAELYAVIMGVLHREGFIHYEVSNYAKAEKYKCRHNLNYWNRGNYFAFGPSAHGFMGNARYWNTKSLKKYYEMIFADKLSIEGSEKLSKNDILIEKIMTGLRSEGLDVKATKLYYDFDVIKKAGEILDELIEAGLIKFDNNILSLTDRGYMIADEIIVRIIKYI